MKPLRSHLLRLALASVALAAPFAVAQPAGGPSKPDYPTGQVPFGSHLRDRQSEPLKHESTAAVERVKFSDPSKPGTLKVSLPWAEVHVSGTDGDEVVVTSSLEKKGRSEVDEDGFRRLDEDVSFEVTEKNNIATIVMSGDNLWSAQGAEFHVQVPRNTNLILRSEAGGDVNVENIDGDIDINSMNGEVKLTDISASAVINTMNGEVTATFRQAPTKPVSITSMNGEVDVRLPADTKANLRLRTHNGSIRTNFPEGTLVAKTEKITGGSHSYTISSDAPPKGERLAKVSDEIRKRRDARLTTAAEAPVAQEAPAAVAAPAPVAAVAPVEAPEPPAPQEKHASAKELARLTAKLKDLAPEERARAEADLARLSADDAHRAAARAMAEAARSLSRMPGAYTGAAFGKSIVGTLNGGGIDIQLSTMNGTITLRQVK